MTLKQKIKELQTKGVTLYQIFQNSGVNRSSVYNFANKDKTLSQENYIKLNFFVDELLSEFKT